MTSFVSEIYGQPDAILETAESVQTQLESLAPLLRKVQQGDFRRLIFTGMGSSLSATYPSLLRLARLNIDVHAIEASELLHYRAQNLTPQTLLIVVSQSGRSAEIPGLLDVASQSDTPVLGITNTPGSLLHQRSQEAILIKAGEESTVSTKTYTCTLTLLHLLTTALLGETVDKSVEQIAIVAQAIHQHLDGWRDQMKQLAEKWTRMAFLEYLGRGHSLASAVTGALISKESMKLPTEGMNAGQFRHGPIELVDAHFTGILFTGEAVTRGLNLDLARDIMGYGGQLALIGKLDTAPPGAEWIRIPDCPPALLPLLEIVPVQLFCAEMSVKRGYEAGQFRYIGKVTTHE